MILSLRGNEKSGSRNAFGLFLYLCPKFRTMKKLFFVSALMLCLGLASCDDPAKSRLYMDEGYRLMVNYSKFDEAEQALDKAIKFDKTNYEAYYHRGCVKMNKSRLKDAIADFEKATELKPDYADAYFNIGKAYFLLNDEEKACENYKLAEKYGRPNLEDYLRRCQ